MLCKVGTEETKTINVANAMPLAARYMENGDLLVLCDTKLINVSGGEIKSEYNFSGGDVAEFHIGEDSVAAVCSDNAVSSENEVFLFDSQGQLVYNKSVKGKINSVCCDKSAVYVLCDDSIISISADGSEKSVLCDASVEDIVVLYGTLLKCEKLGTSSVKFE